MVKIDVEKLTRLPTLPTVALQVLRSFADPEVAAQDVVKLIEADPALSGRLLEAANSVRFGIGRPVADLRRAAMLLGKKVVCSLVLGFSLAETSMNRGPFAAYFKRVWLRSFVQGLAARTLAERFMGCPSDEAFALGLVSRVGQLALLKHAPQEFCNCLDEAERRMLPLEVVEAERLGITSHELSWRILSGWQMPEQFLDALRAQSQPPLSVDQGGHDQGLTSYVRVARAAADVIGSSQAGIALVRLHDAMSELLESVDDDVEWLVVSVGKQLRANAALFQIDLAQVGEPESLLSEATEQLTRLAMGVPPGDSQQAPEHLLAENDELRKKVEELTRESTTDPLTTLFNRRYFHRRLQEAIARAARQRQPLGVLIADIDGFKAINDQHGHPVGDQVLRIVAQALEQSVRTNDLVARFGGEEFVVLADATTIDGLRALAERIRLAVASAPVTGLHGKLTTTISIGGVLGAPPVGAAEFDSRLLSEADRCLYQAKSSGRNCVVVTPLSESVREPKLSASRDRSKSGTLAKE